ncbi:MAG TPA: EamA family transporter [Dehalococcoidia bacterium]|nr:EamA family transporter [Dehalococcoidia bacterium]
MAIDWVSIAILGTIALGLVHIIDSYLISRRMPGLQAYLLPVSIIILFYSIITFFLFPLPEGISSLPLMVAVVSGLLRSAALCILLYILKTEEVSWASPLFHTYPVFVAIMAVPLLGEELRYLQWLAIIIVVAGALIVSVKRGTGRQTIRPGKPFLFLTGASLMIAAADISSKYALEYISSWNIYWISSFCMAGLFLLVSLRSSVIRNIKNMPWRNPALVMIALNETLAMVGIVLIFWAMDTGPVSLVSTISSSRPIFVLILALVVNRFLPGSLMEGRTSKGVLAIRLIATAMIVGGIAIIYLV